MKFTVTLLTLLPFALASPLFNSTGTHEFSKRAQPRGIDVWDYQPSINWDTVKAKIAFAYIRATEGTEYTNPSFSSHYTGAANAGLIRGSYHVALPRVSTGGTQATYFLENGGGWSADGITLPGALVFRVNSYSSCRKKNNLSISSMSSWIRDFSDTYHSKTGRYPVIYTTADWWNMCMGNSTAFGSTNPLWIADSIDKDPLPAGWSSFSFWQRDKSSEVSGLRVDVWNGDMAELQRFAKGS